MKEEINKRAFELISFVQFKSKEDVLTQKELYGSLKEKDFVDLSNLQIGPIIKKTLSHNQETVIEIFRTNENGECGFTEKSCEEFYSLVNNISNLEFFERKASLKFIENAAFNWIIDVYENNKANEDILTYLYNSLDDELSDHVFYFPILNLDIENPFKIGNVELLYFSKEYFDQYFEYVKMEDEKGLEEKYEEFYRENFQGQVMAKITVNAEINKAQELAMRESEIAIDVLKLFSESVMIPEKKMMFDLNYRLTYPTQSNFLTQDLKESKFLDYRISYNNSNTIINDEKLIFFNDFGLSKFSDFLLFKPKNDLSNLIVQSINLFGTAISNWDLHLRCINIITIVESILLKVDENKDLERRTKVRLSKILTSDYSEKQYIISLFSEIYQVRHKMVHKARRIDINSKNLSKVQFYIVQLFLKLIDKNTIDNFENKNSLIEELNKMKV